MSGCCCCCCCPSPPGTRLSRGYRRVALTDRDLITVTVNTAVRYLLLFLLSARVLRFECCEGFHRVPGQEGCAGGIYISHCVIDKIIIIILYLFKWNHWKTYWRRRESWAPPISFAMSKNPVCRKNGLAKGYQNCVQIYLWKEIWIIWKKAFTLFAPTNEAFASIPRELRARVDSFRGNIENPILRYHVSDRKITSDTFQADQTVPTLYNGNRLRINKYSSGVSFIIPNHWITFKIAGWFCTPRQMLTVNCRTIVRKDQEATNGVVHMIDSLLDPGAVLSRDVSEIVTTVFYSIKLVNYVFNWLIDCAGRAILGAGQSHGRVGLLQ